MKDLLKEEKVIKVVTAEIKDKGRQKTEEKATHAAKTNTAAQKLSTDKILKKMRNSVSRDELSHISELSVNVPNFLIIGAQKGGTTWLHANLKKHPEILLPSGKKELEFFSYQSNLDSSSLSRYLSYFNKINSLLLRPHLPKAVGEATPSYFWSVDPDRVWSNPPGGFNHNIPASVHSMLGPDVKLILCLRNPVRRAASAYLHHVRFNRIDYTKQSILKVGKQYGIIDMGFYYKHLSTWLSVFNLTNFKVLFYERDIKVNKEKTLKGLCEFLGINPSLYPPSDSINEFHNKGITYKNTEDGVFIQPNSSEKSSLVISKSELEAIYEIYRDDISQLETLLDTKIPEWKL